MTEQDEIYEPVEDIPDVNLRVHAAEIASRIPFPASVPVSDKEIVDRCNTIFNWIKNGGDTND